MGKQVPILDKDGKPIAHHFNCWRCTDGKQFQEIERAIEHQLFIIAERQLELLDLNDENGQTKVIRERVAQPVKK